jgi:lysophospholipase L1-like esterase
MRGVMRLVSAGFLLLGASIAPAVWGLEPSKANPDQWREEIGRFAQLDEAKTPPAGGIVFVGSSSIRLWDTDKSFPEAGVINRGFGGSLVCDSTHFADVLVVKYKPRLVVFYAGDNDINGGKSAEQVHVDFRAFVAKVRAALPEAKIAYISIKPSIARWDQREKQREANRLIAADCAEDEHLEFIDVWPVMLGEDGTPRKEMFVEDGLHLNATGYEAWVKLVQPVLGDPATTSHSRPAT